MTRLVVRLVDFIDFDSHPLLVPSSFSQALLRGIASVVQKGDWFSRS